MHQNDSRIKVLPFTKPMFTTYPILANSLSILQCYDFTYPWLLNNFIQLSSNGLSLNVYDYNYRTCLFFKIQKISKQLIFSYGLDLIDFMINAINDNNYIYLIINKKNIKAYNSEIDYKHDMLIIGYSLEESIFYIADNFDNGKYEVKTCNFSEIRASLNNMKDFENYLGFNGCIELIKFDNTRYRKFKLERIKDSLTDYLEGRGTTTWNTAEFREIYKPFTYGINCYEFIKNQIEIMNDRQVGIQPFHLEWEHKKHIRRIVDYMITNNMINKPESYMRITELEELSLMGRNLVIKYEITKQKGILGKLTHLYNKIADIEKDVYLEIIKLISNTNYQE
mgnify:CR=1 FL=1